MMRHIGRRGAVLGGTASMLVAGRARAQGREVLIGAPNSMTGGFGEGGRQVVVGLQLAVEQVNKAGGIKSLEGATLRVFPADTSSDNPSQAASVTRRLISQDKVSALVGAHTSTMTLSAQIEAERAEVPILTTSYADQIVQRGYRYTFKVAPQSSALSAAGFDDISALFASQGKGKLSRVAVFYGADAASQSIGRSYIDLMKSRGVQLVATGSFPGDLSDPTPVVGPMLATKPQVLFMNAFVNDTILITRTLRSLDVMVPIIGSGSGISVKTLGTSLGKLGDNLMGTLAWNWDVKVPGVKAFDAIYQAANPSEPFAPQEAGEGYAIGQIIAAALEAAKSSDPKAIRDSLAAIDVSTILPGGRVKFGDNGMNQFIEPILVSWIGGQLRTVWPKEYASAAPVLP